MLDIMGYMDAPALCRLAYTSRALYVFAHVDDLWKGLVVQVRVPIVRQRKIVSRSTVHRRSTHVKYDLWH